MRDYEIVLEVGKQKEKNMMTIIVIGLILAVGYAIYLAMRVKTGAIEIDSQGYQGSATGTIGSQEINQPDDRLSDYNDGLLVPVTNLNDGTQEIQQSEDYNSVTEINLDNEQVQSKSEAYTVTDINLDEETEETEETEGSKRY